MVINSLLAAGPGDILPVIFVLIAIASGIVNFVKERRAAEQARPRREGDGDVADPELQSEIDAFLQEVSGDGGSNTDRQARNQQERQRKRRRSREEEERRRRIRARRERERRQKEEAEAARHESVADRHLDTSDIGEISERHVQSRVESRHLESHIDDEVLGEEVVHESESLTEDSPQTAAGFTQRDLVAMLRQPEGIQSAILMNEVLSPPVSRRPRK